MRASCALRAPPLTLSHVLAQALMLPEAVRMLYVLKHALGKRVYVHCTAGINRATLTVVGYLTFVQVTMGSLSTHAPGRAAVFELRLPLFTWSTWQSPATVMKS